MTRTTITDPKPEKSTAWLTATITDGVAVLLGADSVLESLTLTLCEERSGTIINSRARQSVLGTNGGSVSSLGVVSLRLDPLDMVMVSDRKQEVHVALLEWTWGDPLKSGKHEVAFTVVDLAKV